LLFGLGLPEWLTIIGLIGSLFLTFWLMAKGSIAYEKARKRREAAAASQSQAGNRSEIGSDDKQRKEET